MTVAFDWTEQKVAELKRLLEEGRSCADVAAALGNGCTRNAVIGKARRLEIASGTRWARRTNEQPAPRADRPEKAPRAPRPKVAPIPRPSAPSSAAPFLRPLRAPKRRTPVLYVPGTPAAITEVTGCRWEISGSFNVADYVFCNAKTKDGQSYCPHHDQMKVASYSRELIRNTVRAALLTQKRGAA